MKLKTLAITVIVLALASGVVFWLNRPKNKPSEDARIGQPLVDAAAAEKIARLQITDQGKSVTVAKGSDGQWTVPSYHDFPADFQKLSGLVSELTTAKVEQFVSARPEKVGRLEFKDTKIELLDQENKPLVGIILGKTADAGGRFVKFDGSDRAYRANLNTWLDTEAKNWADATLLSLKADDVSKVEYTLPDGNTVVASRTKKEEPFSAENAPSGQRLKSEKVTALLSSLAGLRFSDTSDLSDPNAAAAKQNARTAKLTTFDGKPVTVAIGRKPEQKIVKPPAPKTDGTTGPAALGSVADLAKTPAPGAKADQAAPGAPKLVEPETETIPAGPVYVSISHSESSAKINLLMAKRAFQVGEWSFTSLPGTKEEFFESLPTPTPVPTPSPAPAP